MNPRTLCVVCLLFVCLLAILQPHGVSASKFRKLYPSQGNEADTVPGQSKFKKLYGQGKTLVEEQVNKYQERQKDTRDDVPTEQPQPQQPQQPLKPQPQQSKNPLQTHTQSTQPHAPPQTDSHSYLSLENIGILAFCALLGVSSAWIQIKKYPQKQAKPNTQVEDEKGNIENKTETSENETYQSGASGTADAVDGNVVDGNVVDGNVVDGNVVDKNIVDGNMVDGNVVDGKMDENVTGGSGMNVDGDKHLDALDGITTTNDKDTERKAVETNNQKKKHSSKNRKGIQDESDEDDWIEIGNEHPLEAEHDVPKDISSDSEVELQVARASSASTVEFGDMQISRRSKSLNGDVNELRGMFENLDIEPKDMSVSEKLQAIKLLQKEREISLLHEQHTSTLTLKRKTHSLRMQKELRSRGKELERQNSLMEELDRKRAQSDEYHKIVILHLAAGIMVSIWLQVMNLSLFSRPLFPSLDLPKPTYYSTFTSSLSWFSWASSFVSWAYAVRFAQVAALVVVLILLWVFVSRLAPYVVLMLVFFHVWQSLLRAGLYFVVYWGIVSFSFATLGRTLRERKLTKLSALYIINLLVAVLFGGPIARGDPLNPYRVSYLPDQIVEHVLSFLS